MCGVFSLLTIMLFSSCGSENKWIPDIQGSNVSEIEYEEINGEYTADIFSNYSSFAKSAWADYYFNIMDQKPAKEERYTKVFFKDMDLIIIKFNVSEGGLEFYVSDVMKNDGVITVTLLPIKKHEDAEQSHTYCCCVETAMDVTGCDVKLLFEETVRYDSISFPYIVEDVTMGSTDILGNQPEPLVFLITGKQGIRDFFDYDEVMSERNLYVSIPLSSYPDDTYEEQNLMLVRVLSSVWERPSNGPAVNIDGSTLNIVSAFSDHYASESTPHHRLLALFVPKDFEPEQVVRTIYYEYEDDLAEKKVVSPYTRLETTDYSDNLKIISFEKSHD